MAESAWITASYTTASPAGATEEAPLRFRDCSACARRLRDTWFCPQCGRPCCSWHCLDRHLASHVEAAAHR